MQKNTPAGKLIKTYATMNNYSIADLSNLSGISYSHLTNLMRGERVIEKKHIVKIADALKLNHAQREELRENVFISNKKIVLNNEKGDIPNYILKLIYLIIKRRHNISKDMVKECMNIIKAIKTDPNETYFFGE